MNNKEKAQRIAKALCDHNEWFDDPAELVEIVLNFIDEDSRGERMTEIINIPVKLYRTPDGGHTCAIDWSKDGVCPFLMNIWTSLCFFDQDRPLQRDKDGMGWMIPSDKCPLKKVIVDARKMIVEVKSVICPHCDHPQSGWISDPRAGQVDACEDCGKEYTVPKDIEVVVR